MFAYSICCYRPQLKAISKRRGRTTTCKKRENHGMIEEDDKVNQWCEFALDRESILNLIVM
jgi:hypothetical protein